MSKLINSEQQSSYRQIMKATSLFGGVQVFNILIAIIRSKFIAILLGPNGMGIAGLLTATTGFVSALTDFGLKTSAVKSVAAANGAEDQIRTGIIVTVLRRWVWVTGLLGMIVTIMTAPLLSRLTFGNNDYTFSFIYISVSLLLMQLSNGQLVLLQGMRKLQYLAKANLAGSILSLILTVPLYYLLGIQGIVPAIIISAVVILVASWFYARKVEIAKIAVSKSTALLEGKEMLTMGFMISIGSLMGIGAAYIVRVFISSTGGVEQVGLYIAGFAIINTYVGLIFNAMGTDYFPRLSESAHSNELCKRIINQQAEIAILILAPIIMLFLVFMQWIIIILYSDKFIPVNSMIHWAILGILFKATSWAIAFIFLAKGDSKWFLINETLGSIYVLILNILGYYFMGLTGIGISFVIGYVLYLFQVFFFSNNKYNFNFDIHFIKIFIIQFLLTLSCFIIVKAVDNNYSYLIGIIFIIVSCIYSYKELEKRIGLKVIIINFRDIYLKKKK